MAGFASGLAAGTLAASPGGARSGDPPGRAWREDRGAPRFDRAPGKIAHGRRHRRAEAERRHGAGIDHGGLGEAGECGGGARREQQDEIDAADEERRAGRRREGLRRLRFIKHAPAQGEAVGREKPGKIAGDSTSRRVEQRPRPRASGAVLPGGARSRHIAAGAFDGRESRRCAPPRPWHRPPPARRCRGATGKLGKGAHAIGAGEEDRLHAGEIARQLSRRVAGNVAIASSGSITAAMPRAASASASGLASSPGRVMRAVSAIASAPDPSEGGSGLAAQRLAGRTT